MTRGKARRAAVCASVIAVASTGAAAVATTSCGGASDVVVESAPSRPLEERRALEIITFTVAESGLAVARGEGVMLGPRQPVPIDLRLVGTPFAIEWISSQNRAERGALFPLPAPDGQLRVLTGTAADAGVQVLLLEASDYTYAAVPGQSSAREDDVEARLRRDVLDYLEYVRSAAP